jgi:hypothetical protein
MNRSSLVAGWRRYRSFLIGFAFGAFAVTLLTYRPTTRVFKPALEDSPDFRAALRFIDQDEPEKALPILRKIQDELSQPALLLFYLGVALDGQRQQWAEAESLVSSALASPEAEKAFVTWGRRHPKVVFALEEFAERRLKSARTAPTNEDESDPDDRTEPVQTGRERRNDLAKKALLVADRINADSPKTQYLLAIIEESRVTLARQTSASHG